MSPGKIPRWRNTKGLGPSAHSSYLKLLGEEGALGLATFLALLVSILFRTVNLRGLAARNKTLMVGCFAGMVGFALHAITEDLFAFSKMAMLFSVIAAIALSLRRDAEGSVGPAVPP